MDINQAIKEAAEVFITEQSGTSQKSLNDSVIEALKLYVTEKGGTPASNSINDLVSQATAYYFAEQSVSPAPRGNDAVFKATGLYLTAKSEYVPASYNERLSASASYFITNGSSTATIPTTSGTSVSYNGATWPLSTAMEVGYFVDGQPFVVADTATVGATSPATAQVACDAYTESTLGAVTAGTLYWANGVMKNPYFAGYPTPGVQSFDELFALSTGTSQAAGRLAYSHAGNIDAAATGVGIPIVPGDAFSLVKFIRKTGLTTPNDTLGSWRHADNYSVLHVVPTAPPVGSFAPCCSLDDADTDRLNYFTLPQMNRAALGTGFTLPGSMPDIAACDAAGSVPSSSLTGHICSSFQPFFGQWGEYQRRFMINPSFAGAGGVNGENGGYSRDWGKKWGEHLAAVLSEGSSVSDADLIKVVQIGLQIIGLHKRGSRGIAGAGQGAGHKQFVQLVAHLFHNSHSGIVTRALEFVGNCTGQQIWVGPEREGIYVTNGATGSNHFHNRRTYTSEHIGRPQWVVEIADPRDDSNFDTDYEVGSAESASFLERTNICNLKSGPSGHDGSRVICGGVTDYSTPESASVAYGYRYRTLYASDIHGSTLNNKADPDHVTYFDNSAPSWEVPEWQGPPEDMTIYPGKYASFLTAGATSFSWDMTSIGGENGETVLEWQVQYSLDRLTWIDVTTQGVSGTQTGLTPGIKHYVRWRRQSASGWGPWSTNMKRQSTDALEQMIITPSNAASGTVVNTTAPAIYQPIYPLFWDLYHEPATTPVPLADVSSTVFWAGVGYWSGNISGGATYQWKADGVNISGETGQSFSNAAAVISTTADVDLTVTVTYGGVSATSPAIVLPQATAAESWIARMTTPPPPAEEALITTFVDALETDGLWTKIDGIHAPLGTAQAARQNAKGSAYPLTYQGGMSDSDYTPYLGFTGDGTAKYLDTGFADSTATGNWSQNAGVWGCYISADGGGTNAALGLTAGSSTSVTPNISGNVRGRIHSAGNASVSSGSSRLGWSAALRNSSTSCYAIRGTTAGAAYTTASNTPVAGTLTMFRATSAYAADQISFHFWGALTKAEYDTFIGHATTFVNGLAALA